MRISWQKDLLFKLVELSFDAKQDAVEVIQQEYKSLQEKYAECSDELLDEVISKSAEAIEQEPVETNDVNELAEGVCSPLPSSPVKIRREDRVLDINFDTINQTANEGRELELIKAITGSDAFNDCISAYVYAVMFNNKAEANIAERLDTKVEQDSKAKSVDLNDIRELSYLDEEDYDNHDLGLDCFNVFFANTSCVKNEKFFAKFIRLNKIVINQGDNKPSFTQDDFYKAFGVLINDLESLSTGKNGTDKISIQNLVLSLKLVLLDIKKEYLQQLGSQVAELQQPESQAAELAELQQQLESEVAGLQQQLESQVAGLQQQLDSKTEELAAANKQRESQVAGLQQQLESKTEELAVANKQRESQVAGLQQQLESKTEELAAANKQRESQVAGLQQQLESQVAGLAEANKQLKSQVLANNALTKSVLEKNAKYKREVKGVDKKSNFMTVLTLLVIARFKMLTPMVAFIVCLVMSVLNLFFKNDLHNELLKSKEKERNKLLPQESSSFNKELLGEGFVNAFESILVPNNKIR
jgi:hypothetical protein